MKKKDNKIKKYQNEDVAYIIVFNRFNKIAFLDGILFIVLAIMNLPFLYNPEVDQFVFSIAGKPTFTMGGNLTAYLFLGIIPALFGLIFILFSILTSRKILLILNKDGSCRYVKKGISNLLLDTQLDFMMKEKVQQIQLGKRHHRFVIWAPVAFMIFLIFLIEDYMNFLDPTFDITTTFFGMEYSVKTMFLINIFFIIGILLPITMLPRKLCRLDTSEEYVKFDYTKFKLERISDTEVDLPYIKPFEILSGGRSILPSNEEQKKELPENFPEVLRTQANLKNFKHFPLLLLVLNTTLLVIAILPFIIPNFFLGGFTLKIEYFLIIAAYYFIVRTLHYFWYTNQEISLDNNNSDLIIKRTNRIFGDFIEYFEGIDKIEQDFAPRKPHYLEFALFFLPFMQLIWVIANIFTFPEYFFTKNPYTALYFIVIIAIFIITAAEYIFPRSMLSITPKAQGEQRKRTETYSIYFPSETVLKTPPLKDAIKEKKFLKNSLIGLLLILIPVIFRIIWIILSLQEIVPPIYDTIF